MGGHENIRSLWEENIEKTALIIFVVDASEPTLLQEAASAFSELVSYPSLSPETPLLILANKQDKNNTLSPEEIQHFIFLGGEHKFWREVGVVEEKEREAMDGRGKEYEEMKREYEKRRELERKECEMRNRAGLLGGEHCISFETERVQRQGKGLEVPGWDLDRKKERVGKRVTTSNIRQKRKEGERRGGRKTAVGRRATTSQVHERRREMQREEERNAKRNQNHVYVTVSPPAKKPVPRSSNEREKRRQLKERVKVLPSSAETPEGIAPVIEWIEEVVPSASPCLSSSSPSPSHHFFNFSFSISH